MAFPGRLVILVVEDNPGDVYMLREAMSCAGFEHQLHVVTDGADALRFLRREGPYAAAPRPDLMILDLNLPAVPGRDVLEQMHQSQEHPGVPVAVFTSSAAESGICQDFPRVRCMFATKTADPDELVRIVRHFADFALSA